jgi:hypothetical protein
MTAEAHGTAVVLAVVEDRRKVLRSELKTLASIAMRLGGESEGEAPAPTPARPKPNRRNANQPHPNSQQAAHERSETLFRLLIQKGGQVAPGTAREALNMTQGQVRCAGERLMKQGRMKRSGERNRTLYEAIATSDDGPAAPQAPSATPSVPSAATIPGRILTLAKEKEGVILGELVADLNLPEDKVREECGRLIAEEELRMARRNGDSIYIVVGMA